MTTSFERFFRKAIPDDGVGLKAGLKLEG